MRLHINPHTATPVYRQIERQIALAIAERGLRPGDALPLEGQLAAELVVSPSSVRKAYESLESAGLCSNRFPGERFRVALPRPGSAPSPDSDLALSLIQRPLLTRELRSARETQARLLPPGDLDGEGWRCTARRLAAGSLAGDFYDVIEEEDGRIAVVVGDVAGKGLAAGLIMAAVKSILPFVAAGRPADAVLHELNGRLFTMLGRREFVALALARLDPRNGRLELANAGLPDPYLLKSGGAIATLPVAGARLPLGLRAAISYSILHCTLKPGDGLLLITDGLPEATDPQGEPIGYRSLTRILAQSARATRISHRAERNSRSLPDRLFDLTGERTGGIPEDDWTAVLLEYRRSREEN